MKLNNILLLSTLIVVVVADANATQVSKTNWLSAMETALPEAFCNPSQYFRQCFSVSARECEEVAASTTRICLSQNKAKIPDVLNQPKDGTHWGSIVGRCAGIAYELSLKKKRISNAKCNDASNWQ
jgi:hypothetical protein